MNDRLDCKQKEIETLRTEVEELRKKLDETFEKLSATEQSARSAEAEAVKLGSRAEAAEQTVAETHVITHDKRKRSENCIKSWTQGTETTLLMEMPVTIQSRRKPPIFWINQSSRQMFVG